MTTDLTRTTPAGWSVQGLEAAQNDGVHWYRPMPGSTASLRLRVTRPSFETLRFQSHSAGGAYTLTTTLDGRVLRSEQIAQGDLHAAYADLGLSPGTHMVQWSVHCAGGASCLPLQLYGLSVQDIAVKDTTPALALVSAGVALLLAAAFAWLLLGRRTGQARLP